MHRRLFLLSVLLLTLPVSLALGQGGASYNDQARFLAGLPVRGSGLDALAGHRVWVDHAAALDAAWGKQERRQITQVRAWARTFVPASQRTGTAYYMFSGPDILYANTIFPNASTYILCGTEPVGGIPDLSRIPPSHIEPALINLRQSMKTILSFHYFITKEMRVDLQRTELGGTTPILCVFLVRLGNTIHDINYVKSPAPGVRITFSGPSGRAQTLFYFKTDLSNGGGSGGFLNWCAQQGPGMSLVKAASYLMHIGEFSRVREFLLNNSSMIVQDDSGIPLRFFDQNRWAVRLFGTYRGPIALFAKNYQPDLAQAYQVSNPAPLGFAFGYHWQRDRGMLMVATRR